MLNNLETTSVKEIMRKNVYSICEEQNIFEASVLMNSKSVGALPVVDKHGNLLGMLTDRDIVTRCCALGRDIRKTKVKEIMSVNPYKTVPNHACKDVAYLMGELGVRRLPIVENTKLTGIISLSDFAKVLDCQQNDEMPKHQNSICVGLIRKLQKSSHS